MKFREQCRKYGRKLAAPVASVGALALTTIGNAYAALPAALTTGMATLETDAEALFDLVWPVLLTIAFAFALFRLSKRGIRQAA